jgi:hypothetical protein
VSLPIPRNNALPAAPVYLKKSLLLNPSIDFTPYRFSFPFVFLDKPWGKRM